MAAGGMASDSFKPKGCHQRLAGRRGFLQAWVSLLLTSAAERQVRQRCRVSRRVWKRTQDGAVAQGEARLIWDQEAASSNPVCSTKGQSRGWRSGWAKAPPGTAQGMRQVDNLRIQSKPGAALRLGNKPTADASSGMRQYGTAPWWGPGVKSAIATGERPVRFRPVPPNAKAGIGAPAGRKLPLGLHRDCADWLFFLSLRRGQTRGATERRQLWGSRKLWHSENPEGPPQGGPIPNNGEMDMEGLENSKMGSRRRDLTAPCKGCSQRYPGCHDRCGKYGEFRATVARKNEDLKAHQWDVYDPMAPKRRRDL